MQKIIPAVLFVFLFFSGCHQKSAQELVAVNQTDSSRDAAQSFFPVTDFLLGQLNEIDSMPVTPLKIVIENGKTDSTWLKKQEIRAFAQPFLHPVIDSINLQKFFTEKSFLDQTINAFTFSYDATQKLPDSLKLNHWDIYIDPQKNTIQRIYLVKEEIIGNKALITQLTWKVNKWCSIRTILQEPGKAPQIKEQIMKWGFED